MDCGWITATLLPRRQRGGTHRAVVKHIWLDQMARVLCSEPMMTSASSRSMLPTLDDEKDFLGTGMRLRWSQ